MKYYFRIEELVEEKGITVSKLEKELGFGNRAISRWKEENHEPRFENLLKVARYFDVSADYLSGKIDIRKPYAEMMEFSDQDLSLLEYMTENNFTSKDKERMMKFAEILAGMKLELCSKSDIENK